MHGLFIYMLKMLTCSGILYGYYRLALYNERFHQWNRFYILASFLLSIVVPLISFPVAVIEEQNNAMRMINSLPWNALKKETASQYTWQQALAVVMGVISMVLLVKLFAGIIRIIHIRRGASTIFQQQIKLFITQVKDAPFSFFNWLFWRADIDPASENGRRILDHELAHIQQQHSADKIFCSLLLCLFYFNPFFWLFKRELYIIHEFLADKKAINSKDGAAFAQMILQSIPMNKQGANTLTNHFFSSNIKRRLFMITTSNLNKYSYARRISGLAIMIVSFIFIGISSQKIEAQTIEKKIIKQPKDTLIIVNKKAGDGKKIMIDKRVKDNGKKEIIIEKIVDGKEDETIEKEEDIFNVDPSKAPLYIIDGKETDAATLKNFDQKLITTVDVLKGDRVVQEYGDKAKNGVVKISTAKGDNGGKQNVIIKKMLPSAALIYVDGKQISQDEMNQIKPNDIESINVLKGESAIKKYGNKATEGVIEIIMKKAV